MKKQLYKYEEFDAWHLPILSISILDREEQNLIIEDEANERNITISNDDLNDIKEIINKYDLNSLTDFTEKETEEICEKSNMFVLDGSLNTFVVGENKIIFSDIFSYKGLVKNDKLNRLINSYEEIIAIVNKYVG